MVGRPAPFLVYSRERLSRLCKYLQGKGVDLTLTSSIEKYIAGVYDPHGDVFIDKVLLSVVPFLFIPDGNWVILPSNPVAQAYGFPMKVPSRGSNGPDESADL
jgi:hypothetical protein